MRDAISKLCVANPGSPFFLFLDDFYYIDRTDQAEILDLIHRAFKGHNAWIKVSGVRHRLKTFRQNGYSIGLQVPHDAQELSLDLSLEDFVITKSFLEGILRNVCATVGLNLGDVLSDNARNRLVIASGGVPRDYLSLFVDCLDRHIRADEWERISAESVNDRAPALVQQKWQEIHEDTSPTETGELVDRLNDVHNFCIKVIDRNVFLVSSEDLAVAEWGKQISALVEFRFLHRVGHTTLKVGGKGHVGVRYTILALDLPSYAGTHVRSVKQVDFWRPDAVQTVRRKALVHAPSEPYRRRSDDFPRTKGCSH